MGGRNLVGTLDEGMGRENRRCASTCGASVCCVWGKPRRSRATGKYTVLASCA